MVFGHYNADMCTYYNVAVIEFAHGLGSQLKIAIGNVFLGCKRFYATWVDDHGV